MLRHLILSVLFIIVLLCVLNSAYASDSLEYKLATINAGGYVSKDHVTVSQFRGLLDKLSSTYRENRQQVADISVKTQELLKENGVKESLFNIMKGLNQLFAVKAENKKFPNPEYSDSAAAYAMQRREGKSHSEAIRELQSVLKLAVVADCVTTYGKAIVAIEDSVRSVQKGDACGAANGIEIALNRLGTAETKCAGDPDTTKDISTKDISTLRSQLILALAKYVKLCGH